jgi:uncharacterized membrane protein
MTNKLLVASALTAALAMVSIGGAAADDLEKCYGVSKAGKNDCKSATHACAGLTTTDADPGSYIYVPVGTCEKLVNGTLEPKA